MIPELEDALHVDTETWSTVNLRQTGPWVYTEHWSTDVWAGCFARGDGEIEAWNRGMPVPETIQRAYDEGAPFVAHNVGFDRAVFANILGPRYGWPVPPLERWYCSASMAAAMSLPRKLEEGAKLLGCVEQKDMEGHKLMLKMMKPAKRVKCAACGGSGFTTGIRLYYDVPCQICGGHGEFLFWHDGPDLIARGTMYCAQDVATERSFLKKLRPLSPTEREVWLLDQAINERGVLVDLPTVKKALKIVKETVAELNQETHELTDGLALSSQVKKLRLWLATEGLHVENLRKETIVDLLKSANLDDLVRQALELRQEAAKTSTAKLNAYNNRTCVDSRMRDNLMFHAAGTGRWGGRGAQLQNLPARYLLKKYQIDAALEFIAAGCSGDDLRMWFDTPLETISACLRGMIVAKPGHRIIAGDYNAIELRGNAWLAGCKALLDAFDKKRDPYLELASKIYPHVDLSWVDWNDPESVDAAKSEYKHERGVGKAGQLGCGYQMGAPKFQLTCAKDRIFLSDDDSRTVVYTFREENFEIKELWGEMGDAAMEAVRRPDAAVPAAGGRIKFLKHGTWLFMQLPSGRMLSYAAPRIEMRELPWQDEVTGLPAKGWGVTFMAVNSLTHKWSKHHGYGGKWVENAVQALSRDLLASAMLRVEKAGYPVIVSVHDEIVSEVPIGFGSVKEYEEIMCASDPWAAGLPVAAEGWEGPRYRK